jgi:hypothetical protein
MTRSKLEFAKILAALRNDGSDPQQLAQEMNLIKLCYEIEKIENERDAAAVPEPPAAPPPAPKKNILKRIFADSSDEDET